MKYVDAGYIIGLGVLFLYALSLLARRRRLERAAAVAERDRAGVPSTDAAAGPGAGSG